MDFAAEAVVDLIAPPRPAARGGDAAAEAPSFDEHLEAIEDAAPATAVETAPENSAKAAEERQDAIPSPSAPVVFSSPPGLSQITAAILLHLTTAPAASAAQAPDGAPELPLGLPAPPLAPPAAGATAESEVASIPEPPPLLGGATDASEPTATDKAAAPPIAPQAPTNASAPIFASASPAAATQVSQAAAISTPTAQPAAPVEPIAAPTQSAPAPPAHPIAAKPTPRAGKAEAAGNEAKLEGGAVGAETQPASQKSQARIAPVGVAKHGAAPPPASEGPAQLAAPAGGSAGLGAGYAAQSQHAVSDHGVARVAPAAAQVAREIVRRFDGETTRFDVRLDPPELGRVEVRLEVSRDHRVTAVVAADSPQALAELARHARELEQSLQSAGLQLADDGLSFDLRQSRDEAEHAADDSNAGGVADGDEGDAEAPIAARPIGLEHWRGVRVDVTV